jgi:transmembrane sensor
MKPREIPSPESRDGADAAAGGARSPALDWVLRHGQAGAVCAAVEARLRRRRRAGLGAAAALVLAVVTVGLAWRQRHVPAVPAPVPPADAVVLRPPTQVLPDGTVVELRGDAVVAVDFTPELRRVELRRGEAHFQVAKNPRRPFLVVAGGLAVRAVGTAFAVGLGTKQVEVVVTEGTVALEEPAAPARTGTRLEAGSRAVVALGPPDAPHPAPAVSPLSADELDQRLAWRAPRLEFSGTPLGRALPMFRQDPRHRLVLGDPALADLELSGILRADNVDSLLRLLETEFGVTAEQRGDELVLRRR